MLVVQEHGSDSTLILIILECLYHIFREENPKVLLNETLQHGRLKSLLSEEKIRRSEISRGLSLRHSKFGGIIRSFGVVNLYSRELLHLDFI